MDGRSIWVCATGTDLYAFPVMFSFHMYHNVYLLSPLTNPTNP